MKKVLICMLSATLILLSFTACGKPFEKKSDTVYSILQLTDVHIKNVEKKDKKAFKTITLMIEETKPDLIVVTGDINSEVDNESAMKSFGDFIEKFNIPWAFTFGNHDAEGNWKKPEISAYLDTLPNCIYERGDENVDGYGNYYKNVTDKNGKVIMSLIMMDSNMYAQSGEGYDKFHDNQVEWYKNTVKSIAKEVNGDETKVVPSLAFFHIPMREFTAAYDEAKENKSIISGNRFEDECPGAEDDQMFETMLELKSTKGIFVGHDHMNDYSVEYKGIRMTYGNSSDHNIYLVPRRGGNLINIKADGTFTTQQLIKHRLLPSLTIKEEK